MTIHKIIKFTGDYSKLKPMGYEFQKLFAGNYMQWCKRSGGEWSPTTRIFKKGADVCMDHLTNFEGPFFELYMDYKNRGEELPWEDMMYSGRSLKLVTKQSDFSVSFDYKLYIDQERANMRAFEKDPKADIPDSAFDLQTTWLKESHLVALDELIALGWVELGTIGED